jgi:hypothetical protein
MFAILHLPIPWLVCLLVLYDISKLIDILKPQIEGKSLVSINFTVYTNVRGTNTFRNYENDFVLISRPSQTSTNLAREREIESAIVSSFTQPGSANIMIEKSLWHTDLLHVQLGNTS